MANTARTQIALAAGAHFRSRVKAALAKIAWQVLDESTSTTNHADRAFYAHKVLDSLDGYAASLAGGLVMRTNVLAFTTSFDFDLGTVGEVITASGDADIESQLSTDWSHLAGV